jgi:hypothetical protein
MERFKPDSLLDGLLRPFLLADPQSFLYIEFIAPDFRFLGVAVCVLTILAFGQLRHMSSVRGRALVFLVVSFYGWTFVSGNGRYFLPGLLLAAPILVSLWQDLPGTRTFRSLFLGLIVALHGYVIVDFYTPAPWSVSRWYNGKAIALSKSRIREEPAVFLKVASNSYSALTPHFHPQSRWAMLGDHLRLEDSSFERRRLESLLSSDLPKYVFTVQGADIEDELGQPTPEIRAAIRTSLEPYGVQMTGEACESVSAKENAAGHKDGGSLANAEGFWFCKITRTGSINIARATTTPIPIERQAVLAKLEAACPRFFSSGSGYDAHSDGKSRRTYKGTDLSVFVGVDGAVSYRYMRTLNRTMIGTEVEILEGRVEIPCQRLQGRYRPPWLRD